jgi:hypothetical protein
VAPPQEVRHLNGPAIRHRRITPQAFEKLVSTIAFATAGPFAFRPFHFRNPSGGGCFTLKWRHRPNAAARPVFRQARHSARLARGLFMSPHRRRVNGRGETRNQQQPLSTRSVASPHWNGSEGRDFCRVPLFLRPHFRDEPGVLRTVRKIPLRRCTPLTLALPIFRHRSMMVR